MEGHNKITQPIIQTKWKKNLLCTFVKIIPIYIYIYPLVFRLVKIVLLFLFCYERDFMKDLSSDNQADVMKALNSTSRYLDDLLNTDNPYFEGMVNQIYPSELQLNKANTSKPRPPFGIYICLYLTALFHPKCMINVMTLILI